MCENQRLPGNTFRETAGHKKSLLITILYRLQSVWTQPASNPASGLDRFSILWPRKPKPRAVEFKVAQV